MSSRPALARPVALLASAATVVAVPALAVAPAQAAPGPGSLRISEVYAGGGSSNAAAAYNQDFVELYNPTDQPVALAGSSLQYRSATASTPPTNVHALSGTVPPRSYFLVAEGSVGTGGPALPASDASGTVNLGAGGGTLVLAAQTTGVDPLPTGSVTGNPAVLDLVGWGTSNTFEGTVAAASGVEKTLQRSAAVADTDDNGKDLAVATATPKAPSGPTTPPTDPPPTPTARTIAEIQGTGAASPLAGQTVTTRGVVTAAYPEGGFDGFYLQTAGTGGDVDPATHTASDGVFVFGAAAADAVAIGDHVQVTAPVKEYAGTTELVPAAAGDVVRLSEPAAAVRPATIEHPRTAAGRETFEGMLLAPRGPWTVSDNYALNNYAEVGLASGRTPLYTPTEVADPHDAAAVKQVADDNAARLVTLDDGASVNFLGSGENTALPYLTGQREIRVGAPVTFTAPVVLEERFGGWRFQPTSQVTAADAGPVTFGSTRTSAPRATPGNVHLASFNVLNYFPTTGADTVAAGGSCTWYDDRQDNHNTVRDCTAAGGGDGPRGAAEADDLARQQTKIVRAINGLGADVVSLEEIENSALFGKDRDDAVRRLVAALNESAGAGTWAFVPSPASAADQSGEDVIRTAFIFKPAAVEPVGESVIDDVAVFANARDPLAQAFEPVGGGRHARFVVVVNHFKSKGSGPDDGTGQGLSNPQRVQQSLELKSFAAEVAAARDTDKVFLSGDFNAYTQEDPMRELYRAGYTDIGSDAAPEEHTYLFDGTVGSLDHVLGNAAAMRLVRGAHVWNINSVEPVALEYSRHNYNLTDFFTSEPFRASDHDPLVVGVDLPLGAVATTTTASVSPDPVHTKVDRPEVEVRVASSYGVVEGGVVEVREGGALVGRGTVRGGSVTISLPTTNRKGTHSVEVRYLGTDDAAGSASSATYTVVK